MGFHVSFKARINHITELKTDRHKRKFKDVFVVNAPVKGRPCETLSESNIFKVRFYDKRMNAIRDIEESGYVLIHAFCNSKKVENGASHFYKLSLNGTDCKAITKVEFFE